MGSTLQQPLMVRRTYGQQSEAAMLKTIPLQDYDEAKPESEEDEGACPAMDDYDHPVVEEEVQEDTEEYRVVSPAGRGAPTHLKFIILEDYDQPIEALPMGRPEYFPMDQAVEPSEKPSGGCNLECPHCKEQSQVDEPILKKKINLACPTCGGQVATAGVYKTASGYCAVVAHIQRK